MKKRFYHIIIFIGSLFFLVELIPTLSMNSYIEELSFRLDENEYTDVIGTVSNYYFYEDFIIIYVADVSYSTSYNLKDEYQNSKIFDDIYEGMDINITFFNDKKGYLSDYEIAGLSSNDKTYIQLEDYIELETENYYSAINSHKVHTIIAIVLFCGTLTAFILLKVKSKKEGGLL